MIDIQRILKNITKKINGKRYGVYESKIFGEGIEKSDTTLYSPGENSNRINWKLTAKTDKIIIDKHIRESNLNFYMFFDINYNWLGGNEEKFIDTVIKILGELNLFLSKENYNSEIYFNSNLGLEKSHYELKNYNLLIKQLLNIQKTSKKRYFSGLNNFVKKISNKKNSIIFIFSDTFALNKDNIKYIKYLQANNIVHLFLLDNYQNGINYSFFDIEMPAINKGISYTLI